LAEYTSLAIGSVTGLIVFASTLAYMKHKAKLEEKQNKQAEIHFPEPEEHHPELVAHR